MEVAIKKFENIVQRYIGRAVYCIINDRPFHFETDLSSRLDSSPDTNDERPDTVMILPLKSELKITRLVFYDYSF